MIYEGVLAGFVAGVVRSVMGWLESEDKFDPRRFVMTLIRAGIIGASLGFASTESPVTVFFMTYFSDSVIKGSYNVVKAKTAKDEDSTKVND